MTNGDPGKLAGHRPQHARPVLAARALTSLGGAIIIAGLALAVLGLRVQAAAVIS
jgi:hypothetical protein